MANTPKQKGIPETASTKNPYIIVPRNIVTIHKPLTLRECNFLIEMMAQLQSRIDSILISGRTSIFREEDFDNDGYTTILFDMHSITSRADCFKFVLATAERLTAKHMNEPVFSDACKCRDIYGRSNGFLALRISRSQAAMYFDISHYATVSRDIARHCDSSYTSRIYMLLSLFDTDHIKISYDQLRRYIGIDNTNTYSPYKNFKFKVLEVARHELTAKTDNIFFNFDYQEEYPINVRPSLSIAPEHIKFSLRRPKEFIRDKVSSSANIKNTLSIDDVENSVSNAIKVYDSSIANHTLSTIPTTSGLYRLRIGGDDYIGKAKSLRKRIRQHIHDCNLHTEHSAEINDALLRNHDKYIIEVLITDISPHDLNAFEKQYISLLQPSLNENLKK